MPTVLTLSLAAVTFVVVLASWGRWVTARSEQALAGLSISLPPVL